MGSPAINEQQVVAFLEGLFGEDLHARRVLSLWLATLGVIHAASLSVYAIGQALAVARGKKGKHGVKQVDRLLSNTGVDVWSLFSLWVPYVMGQRTEAVVALDWTDFDDDDHTTLVASLRTHHGRSTVSPDEPTAFVFDSRLAAGAVEFQPEGRLADWAQGKEGLTLHVIPREDYLPGERVKVTVRFADGAAPENATFWLVGHAARGARRVEVFRQPRPADELKKEKDEAHAEARQCQEDKARLLAERKQPGGLMGAAWLGRKGEVASQDISRGLKHYPADALGAREATSYSQPKGETHPGGMAVRLQLANPGAEPWTVAGAVLKDATGAEVELSTWQESAIAPGAKGFVVMGTEREPGQLACPCTLKLWEAQGPRTVTLGDVTFPAGEQAGKQGAARE